MRPQYKIGETVFFMLEGVQSFGCIKAIEIKITDTQTTIQYESEGHVFLESTIVGRAVIQKPRVRKSRAKRAIDQMKAMSA